MSAASIPKKPSFEESFRSALELRRRLGLPQAQEPIRLFHGPGEGYAQYQHLAIDRFASYAWVTLWKPFKDAELDPVASALREAGIQGAVVLHRPTEGLPPPAAVVLFGSPPERPFEVSEGKITLSIRLLGSRHPGLFLDHSPLRRWLESHASGARVLNAFAYTGSLSCAARAGQAAHVTTTDLSGSTLEWAKLNWELNAASNPSCGSDFIAGDAFEVLPLLKRQNTLFDIVILDPPSFSRGKKGTFSTQKDLPKLHRLALDVLKPGGVIVSSINSENVFEGKFLDSLEEAAVQAKRSLALLKRIEQPETFPTRAQDRASRYLKGWIARA